MTDNRDKQANVGCGMPTILLFIVLTCVLYQVIQDIRSRLDKLENEIKIMKEDKK